MMIFLAWHGDLPWEPIAGIAGLGLINTVGRLAYAKRIGRTTNYRSWAMERIVAYTIFLVGFGVAQYQPGFYAWLCFGAMAFIMAHDMKRMLIDPVPA